MIRERLHNLDLSIISVMLYWKGEMLRELTLLLLLIMYDSVVQCNVHGIGIAFDEVVWYHVLIEWFRNYLA